MEQPKFTAKKLKELRIDYGLTQTEMGELIYAPLVTYQSWEYGKREMPLAKWELLLFKLKEVPKPW